MIGYNNLLNTLFDEWIEESERNGEPRDNTENHNIIFTKDGLIEKNDPSKDIEKAWGQSDKKIMFLLKDQPSEYCDDARLWLKDLATDNEKAKSKKEGNRSLRPKFVHNLANLLWGLYNATAVNDCWLGESTHEKVQKTFNTMPFAFVESKKQGGKASIDSTTLRTYLDRYGHLLKREIEILNPNIIVCTNEDIYDFVLNLYPKNELIGFGKGHNSIRYHLKSSTIILCSYHPSAIMSAENFYEGVMFHYRAFLHSNYAKTLE